MKNQQPTKVPKRMSSDKAIDISSSNALEDIAKNKSTEFSKLPRRQRRKIAKSAHLFKDKSHDAWRIASNHMKHNGAPRQK